MIIKYVYKINIMMYQYYINIKYKLFKPLDSIPSQPFTRGCIHTHAIAPCVDYMIISCRY